jgi:hypothetical protein
VYRLAPSHALYQGDIIIVPKAPLTRDPKIITAGQPICDRCGSELPAPASVECVRCAKAAPPHHPRRLTQYSQRYERGEKPFERGHADAAIVVETVAALILSHSCDYDCKKEVKVAPVYPLSAIKKEVDRDKVRGGSALHSYFYLARSDRLPEGYAHLDQTYYVETVTLGDQVPFTSAKEGPTRGLVPFVEVVDDRLASLDGQRIVDLYRRLTWLLIRPDPASVFDFPFSESVFYTDDERPQAAARPRRGWRWPLLAWLVPPAPVTP